MYSRGPAIIKLCFVRHSLTYMRSLPSDLKDWLFQKLLRFSAPLPSSIEGECALALFEPDPKRRVAIITHFDATENSMRDLVDSTRNLRKAFDQVVYVTDYANFNILRMNECIFEFVPPLSQQLLFGSEEPWSNYLTDRWSLLTAKWMPRVVISYGTSFKDIIERAKVFPIGSSIPDPM